MESDLQLVANIVQRVIAAMGPQAPLFTEDELARLEQIATRGHSVQEATHEP